MRRRVTGREFTAFRRVVETSCSGVKLLDLGDGGSMILGQAEDNQPTDTEIYKSV